jgi:hypothetical protein
MNRLFPSLLLSLALLPAFAARAEFPNPGTKKGLQVQMVDDAIALGVKHAGINVSLGALFTAGEPWKINENYAKSLDAQIKPLSDAGVVVYAILLAYPSKQAAKDKLLVHPEARADGKYNISAFNNVTEPGKELYTGLLSFLAKRYSQPSGPHGRVWGWIIGNEVNSQWMWYNLGMQPLAKAVGHYEQAFRIAHQAITQQNPDARLYISLDHHWTASMPGISDQESYPGKAFLDGFAAEVRKNGDFAWHVAHHPYPDDLGNPRTWNDKAATPDENSKHITFKNLEVACRYMRKPELLWQGKPRRIILSEQGIHCLGTPDGEQLQSAGFTYAWEKMNRLDGIDAFIWHRHVDHAKEGGLRLGLWTNKAGEICQPDRKRPFYELFQKADTPEWPAAAAFALPIVGMKSWDEFPQP